MARWTETELDAYRLQGDPVADQVIHALGREKRDRNLVRELLTNLTTNSEVPSEMLPSGVRAYLQNTEPDLTSLLQTTLAGERVFKEFGPEILVILGCYSLPAAYAATNGVKVLAATGYLRSFPTRRLGETLQMVIDVLSPGGLGPNGKGVRTAQKVRLMHATIRHLLLNPDDEKQGAWNTQLHGLPINQEDLAGTLMTFSYVVLHGLERLGCRVTSADRESYIKTWVAIGRILGVDPELLPASFQEAKELTETIQARQTRQVGDDVNKEGRELMKALLDMFSNQIPGKQLDFFAPGMVRHFLPSEVADRLGVPALQGGAKELLVLGALVTFGLERYGSRKAQALVRGFGLNLIDVLLSVDRGPGRPSFSIPETLRTDWKAIEAAQPPWWERFLSWLVGLLGKKWSRA